MRPRSGKGVETHSTSTILKMSVRVGEKKVGQWVVLVPGMFFFYSIRSVSPRHFRRAAQTYTAAARCRVCSAGMMYAKYLGFIPRRFVVVKHSIHKSHLIQPLTTTARVCQFCLPRRTVLRSCRANTLTVLIEPHVADTLPCECPKFLDDISRFLRYLILIVIAIVHKSRRNHPDRSDC